MSRRITDGNFALKRRGVHFMVKEKSMRNAKVLLGGIMLMALLACTMLTVSGPSTADENQRVGVANHWRHHDGHWNYWHDGDQRWYYTDGSNWYYNNGGDGTAWNVYG